MPGRPFKRSIRAACGLDQCPAYRLDHCLAVLGGGIRDLYPPGSDAAHEVGASWPAIGDQDLIDRGGDLIAGHVGQEIGEGLLRFTKRLVYHVAGQAEVGMRRPAFVFLEPRGHETRRLAVQTFTGVPAPTLLIKPPLQLGPRRCVATHRLSMIACSQRFPDLGSPEERHEVPRHASSEIPSHAAPHQTGVLRHVLQPVVCSTRVVNRTLAAAVALDVLAFTGS